MNPPHTAVVIPIDKDGYENQGQGNYGAEEKKPPFKGVRQNDYGEIKHRYQAPSYRLKFNSSFRLPTESSSSTLVSPVDPPRLTCLFKGK